MLAISTRDAGSYSYAGTNYANPHAVTGVGGTTHTYDNNGNVTAIGSLDYTWDWRNRLASAERSGGGITSYGYDHTGQRVFKATGTATTSYPNRYYNVASSSLAATTTKHMFSPDGTLLATVEGSGVGSASTTYLHPDHLGGTNVTTDEDGEVTQTLDYYPYGSQRIVTGSFSEQRRFIGEEFDGDTEFSYLNARYYQGSRGQFMSQDPVFLGIGSGGQDKRSKQQLGALLSDPQLLNAYSYSRNNPLNLSDPSGEFLIVPVILTLAMINQLTYLYSTYQTVQILNNPAATPEQKSAARSGFYSNLVLNAASSVAGGAAGGLSQAQRLALEGGQLLLTGMDYLYGDEVYGELNRRRESGDQSRSQANVAVTNTSNYGSGGSYNYIYSTPSGTRGTGSSHGNSGGNGISSAQIGALHNLVSVVNAGSFNAQAFVSALQAVVQSFNSN
jgi:RHS repeat-associated protein